MKRDIEDAKKEEMPSENQEAPPKKNKEEAEKKKTYEIRKLDKVEFALSVDRDPEVLEREQKAMTYIEKEEMLYGGLTGYVMRAIHRRQDMITVHGRENWFKEYLAKKEAEPTVEEVD
jgi:hypothetical protein